MKFKAILYTIALIGSTALALFLPSIRQEALGRRNAPIGSPGIEQPGRVIGVLSGDTLVVETADRHRVRATLWGIAAPDLHQTYGDAAKMSLAELTYGKSVRLWIEEQGERDHVVATIYTGSLDIGRAQAGRGLAWITPAGEQDRVLSGVQRAARARHAGLWRDPQPVAPWDFRVTMTTGVQR